MRAAVVSRSGAVMRRYLSRVRAGWLAVVSASGPNPARGRHRHRAAVSDAERSGAGRKSSARRETATRQADQAVRALYDSHYRSLTQLAALLAGNLAAAEEIVQAAFAAMHRAWHLLKTSDAALPYLRRQVVRRARCRRPGRRGTAGQAPAPQLPGSPEALRVLDILSTLRARQREAVILRFWVGLSVPQIAEVTGARPHGVARSLKRGLAVLAADPGDHGSVGHPQACGTADMPAPSGRPTAR
jgi:DNA-directed RNA polymerase specialized sigma24 family protein